MKRQVLFIQGGGDGAHEVDGLLVESLRRSLEASYQVIYPEMPNEGMPDYETWKVQISQELASLDGHVILVGHSVGGYLLVKYLSEEPRPEQPIVAICLIALPYPWGDENWQYEGFSFPEDFGPKLPDEARIFLYHSRDDQTVPFAHLALYAKALPNATIRETRGGHQLGNDLSVLAADIKSI